MNEHLGYAVWSSNGEKWHGPAMLDGIYGHYIWRATTHRRKAYFCGRRNRKFVKTSSAKVRQGVILKSDGGLRWKMQGIIRNEYGNENAFYVEPNGTMLALARGGGQYNVLNGGGIIWWEAARRCPVSQ